MGVSDFLALPGYLESDEAPRSWAGSVEEWGELLGQARSGQPEARSLILGLRQRDGSDAAQASLPHVSADLALACRETLKEAHRLGLRLQGVLALALEHAAWYGTGIERDVRRKLEAAQAAVGARQAELEVKRREADAMPVLTVHFRFRAKGGKHYTPGEYRITPELAAELTDWQDKMEAQAQLYGFDAPSGFTRATWPPFAIVTPAPVP